jgi:hypothetical protein
VIDSLDRSKFKVLGSFGAFLGVLSVAVLAVFDRSNRSIDRESWV